jgi:hypothetical protein
MKKKQEKKEDYTVDIKMDLERACHFCIHNNFCHVRITTEMTALQSKHIATTCFNLSSSVLSHRTSTRTLLTCLGNACFAFKKNKSENIEDYDVGTFL